MCPGKIRCRLCPLSPQTRYIPVELVGDDCEFEAVRAAVNVMSKRMDNGSELVSMDTKVHGVAYSAVGSDDPYHDLKVRADEMVVRYVELLDEAVKGSDNPLRTAVMAAAMDNILNFSNDKSIDDQTSS